MCVSPTGGGEDRHPTGAAVAPGRASGLLGAVEALLNRFSTFGYTFPGETSDTTLVVVFSEAQPRGQ